MTPSACQDGSSALAASGGIEALARVGYVAHGIIYVLIGGLAARLAWGARGELADPPSVLLILGELPAGRLWLGLTAVGLVAYALWRWVQAVADPDGQGRSLKGLFVRAGRMASGLGYFALAVFACRLALGGLSAEGGEGGAPSWAYRLLTEPVGVMAGGVVALILFCVAADDTRKAFTTNYGERLKDEDMGVALRLVTSLAGSWGFAARAVILVFGGVYLVRAVLTAEPQEAKGFEGILAGLLMLPHGHWVLGMVALGLAGYGFFMVQAGLYRRHPV